MPTIHDDAHALDWNKLFHSLNGMPKHRTRSNDIRELLRTVQTSLSFQIFAHSNAITTSQDDRP
jgi:hypothetical protein